MVISCKHLLGWERDREEEGRGGWVDKRGQEGGGKGEGSGRVGGRGKT